jgi:hypothetical protein
MKAEPDQLSAARVQNLSILLAARGRRASLEANASFPSSSRTLHKNAGS